MERRKYGIPSYPNNSKLISKEVIGQFVTPQNTEVMPTAVHKVGENPNRFPYRQPKAAPVQKEGTISPPLYPAPKVSAVKSILRINASGLTVPLIHLSMMFIPVPLYVWLPTMMVAASTKQPPANTLKY